MKKYILFITSLILTTLTLSTSTAQALGINGYIVVDKDQYLLIELETARTYKVQPSNSHVRKSLGQLATFDAIRGQVSSKGAETLMLETIDFVSLRRLLGDWTDQTARVSFVDFSRVSFDMEGNSRQFVYALSPGKANTWRIYLTDQSSVVLGTLNVDGARAVLEFYDPQTGATAQHLQLSKVPPRLDP